MFNHTTHAGHPRRARTFRVAAAGVATLIVLASVDLSADRRGSGGSVRQSRNSGGGADRSNNYNRNTNVNRNTSTRSSPFLRPCEPEGVMAGALIARLSDRLIRTM